MVNKLGGVTVGSSHRGFENSSTYTVLVDNYKETESMCYLYFDKVVATKNGDVVSMIKISEFALIASYDKQTKILTGKDVLESFSTANNPGKKPEILGFEQYEIDSGNELADFLRRYIFETNPYLFKTFAEILDRDAEWHSFLMYLDDLDNIEKLCSTMNPRDILSQLYNNRLVFDNGKKLRSIVGIPTDIMETLNNLDLGNTLHHIQTCIRNETATVEEIRNLLSFITGYNVIANKKKNNLHYICSSSFLDYVFEAHKYGFTIRDITNCIAREILLYQGLFDSAPSRIAMNIRDIAKMLTDMNQELVMQQNVKKWHFVTSRNYKLFKSSRAEEYDIAATMLNDVYAAKIQNYLIQCPDTEQELFMIGTKYCNCLPTYRDRVIDENAKIFSLYLLDDNGNVIEDVPSVTFEINDDLDFIQVKTFFDADVTDTEILSVLREWRKKVKNNINNVERKD